MNNANTSAAEKNLLLSVILDSFSFANNFDSLWSMRKVALETETHENRV